MVTRKSISLEDKISLQDAVCFTIGTTPVRGIVVEDRGQIGADRVRLFSIRLPSDADQIGGEVIEMPDDELIPVGEAVDYLKDGGLVAILKSNAGGGKNPPRVWLWRDKSGNVIHTFEVGLGVVGGCAAPPLALHEDRIFTPKVQEVTNFLQNFGLSEGDALSVVNAVGMSP
jgi:hypothetical protein